MEGINKMNKNEQIANIVLEKIGGKNNISYLTHCVTRLRFNLKDQSLADNKEIEKISGVVGCQVQNGQLQVIIGQTVGDVYDAVCKLADIKKEEAIQENLDPGTKKKISFSAILDGITGSLAPNIPLLIGGGMIKVLVLLLSMAKILSPTSQTYTILSFVGDAAFYFLPVFIGATAAKKFNTSVPLGMLFGAILIHPTFVSLVTAGKPLSFIGLPVTLASYSSTVFPIIMIVWIMSYVERFFSKISPISIKSLFVPLMVILVMLPVALCAVGPLGVLLGNYVSKAIIYLYNTAGFLGVATMSALFPLLVLTGMHTTMMPYLVTMMTTVGHEPLVLIAGFIVNLSQGAACAAVAIRAKNKDLKSTAVTCAITAIVGGVTEPALFGVNLKLRRPLYAVMAGGFIGGLYAGITKVYGYSFPGSMGLFGLASFIGPQGSNLINAVISMVIGMVATFIITLILGFKED
jgi:PTS system beta-glucosides-specific IIC component